MTNLDNILKGRDITLLKKVHRVKNYSFSKSHVQMWEMDHREGFHQRIDAYKLWCWRRLLRVPWTARRSNQSILKEISHEYSLEGLMLKQASDLASNCLDTALTVSALTACSECKTCGTADKIMDKSWNCWAPEVGLADQAPGLTAFHLQDKTNSIIMKPELQFAHRLMKASVSVLGLSAGTLNWNLWTHTHRVDLLPGTFSQLGLQMCCDLGLPRAIWVWMLVRTQFDDVASAVFISVFF